MQPLGETDWVPDEIFPEFPEDWDVERATARPASATLVFLVFNFFLFLLLRWIVMAPTRFKWTNKTPQVKNIQRVLCCFIAAMEDCAYFFEFGVIYEWPYSGGYWFYVIVATQMLLSRVTNGYLTESFPNSLSVITNIYKGTLKMRLGMLIFILQMLAAIASYRYSMWIWSWGVSEEHWRRYNSTETCSHYVDDTLPNYLGKAMLIEGAACTVDTLFDILEPDRMHNFWSLLHVLSMALVYVQGTEATGGFFNPGMALGHLWDCRGLTHFEFFLIYFISPILCTLGAVIVVKLIVCETKIERKRLLFVLKGKIPDFFRRLPRVVARFFGNLLNDVFPFQQRRNSRSEEEIPIVRRSVSRSQSESYKLSDQQREQNRRSYIYRHV